MKKESQTAIVLFGITGNLMRSKIFPALFELFTEEKLATGTHFVGVSRRDFSDSDFQNLVKESISTQKEDKYGTFLSLFKHISGELDESTTYTKLSKELLSQNYTTVLFYIALPAILYEAVGTHISDSTYLTKETQDKYIMLEKPFGISGVGAKKLNIVLHKIFAEKEIFRVDHYLVKKVVQQISALKINNSYFEEKLRTMDVQNITIELLEKKNASGRGAFYDSTGAFNDVGQNHMLSILSTLTMEYHSEENKNITDRREEILKCIALGKGKYIRAQYKGFQNENGVKKDSQTETFFSVPLRIATKRWSDVTFRLISGKGLDCSRVRIVLTSQDKKEYVITVQPEEMFEGFENIDIPNVSSLSEYALLFSEALHGKQDLFVGNNEINENWRIAEEIKKTLEKETLTHYTTGSSVQEITSIEEKPS